MTLDELYTHYNQNWAEAARQISVCNTTIQNWRNQGYIPTKWQKRIEFITKRKLEARFEDVPND